MARLFVVVDDGVERRLRLAVATIGSGKKGGLSALIEEAVDDWLKKHSKEIERAAKRIA